MDWITNLISLRKIPTRVIFLTWFISALMLYLPSNLLETLHLVEFKSLYGQYLGVTFLISSGLLLAVIVSWIYSSIAQRRANVEFRKLVLSSLDRLDTHEVAALREFYIQGKNTLKMPMDNATISGLISKGIIQQVGQYGAMSVVGMLLNYRITDLARQHLTKEILGLPRHEPSEQEKQRIINARPGWMRGVESRQRLIDSIY